MVNLKLTLSLLIVKLTMLINYWYIQKYRRNKMLTKFDDIIEITLHHEGGYVNDPKDPGGETNFGVAKRSHPDVDIKNLTKEGYDKSDGFIVDDDDFEDILSSESTELSCEETDEKSNYTNDIIGKQIIFTLGFRIV